MEETLEREKSQLNLKLKDVSEMKKHAKIQNEMLNDLKVVLIDSHQQ